ncbi:hypothetical protein FRC04_003738 [Tulasnella sp. 424]|nr:hypothetical protein FRC04_003738 [Tulasnella sp. 424]KAG8977067.1 hypothetical protein FRC05_002588 [Tulasnella sp. 425]
MVEPFLQDHGFYLLRREDMGYPKDSRRAGFLFGIDSISQSAHTYPARDKNGRKVFIKMVPLYPSDSQEYEIWRLLDSEKHRRDPRNHTVPVREVLFFSPDFTSAGFGSQRSDMRAFVVMDAFDVLRSSDLRPRPNQYPVFRSVQDVLDFALQTVETVDFLHELGIAHQDIYDRNILVDTGQSPMSWLLGDFQLSAYFPRPWRSPPTVFTRQIHIPELPSSSASGFDPFKADVYNLGDMIHTVRWKLKDKHWDWPEEFSLLIGSMRSQDPTTRPLMDDVVRRMRSINPQETLTKVPSAGNWVTPTGSISIAAAFGVLAIALYRRRLAYT